jgi:hypothetical protein
VILYETRITSENLRLLQYFRYEQEKTACFCRVRLIKEREGKPTRSPWDPDVYSKITAL